VVFYAVVRVVLPVSGNNPMEVFVKIKMIGKKLQNS